MTKRKPTIMQYPGNKWLTAGLGKAGSIASVPFIHGFIRGAIANPFAVDPAAAMTKVLADVKSEKSSPAAWEKLSLALLHLWNDTTGALSSSHGMPEALSSGYRTGENESGLLFEAADLAEGFVEGFKLKKPPIGRRLPCAGAWLRDLEGEGDWCRMMFENPDKLAEEMPDPGDRRKSILDALCWIEECMRWVFVYARADVEGTASYGGGASLARKSPCPCGSGKKYKRCCGKKGKGDKRSGIRDKR